MEKLKITRIKEGFFSHKNRYYPQEWYKVRLDKVTDIVSGGTPSSENPEFWGGNIPWATPSDININRKYISDTERRITELGIKNSSAALLPINSVLMCSRASIGPRSINKIPMTTNQGFKSFICLKDILDYNYLYYLVGLIEKDFKRLACGSTFLEISKRDISKYEVVIPKNMYEQQKIAEILSTWDKAIELKEQLIEEKKKQKSGLMQKLLTGKVRLPGFDEEVNCPKLENYIEEVKIKNKENNESRVLSVTNKQGFILQEDQFDRIVASKDLSNYKIVKKGEFAYNPSRVNVGSIDLLKNFESGLLSPMYVVFKCKEKLNSDYLYHFIKSEVFLNIIPNMLQGSVRDSLSFDSLKLIQLLIPSLEEQKAIAEVLNTADKEINLLEKELKSLKLQKKGLMQILLTGIVRVQC